MTPSTHRKFSTLLNSFLLAASLLFVSACSTIQVSQDYDSSVDFSQYKTFAWQPAAQQVEPTAADFKKRMPLVAKRIEQAIDTTLKAKGLALVANNADAFVTYRVSKTLKEEPVRTSVGFGSYGGFGGIGFQVSPDRDTYEEGRLVIDLITQDGALIWRGISTRTVQEHNDPDELTKEINETVSKLLAQYPPK